MDVVEFVSRLKAELKSSAKWFEVAAVATCENQDDLMPNELLVFLRSGHPERDAICAFHVTVTAVHFPPDDDRRNGR
jgi:hypothetical protein